MSQTLLPFRHLGWVEAFLIRGDDLSLVQQKPRWKENPQNGWQNGTFSTKEISFPQRADSGSRILKVLFEVDHCWHWFFLQLLGYTSRNLSLCRNCQKAGNPACLVPFCCYLTRCLYSRQGQFLAQWTVANSDKECGMIHYTWADARLSNCH